MPVPFEERDPTELTDDELCDRIRAALATRRFPADLVQPEEVVRPLHDMEAASRTPIRQQDWWRRLRKYAISIAVAVVVVIIVVALWPDGDPPGHGFEPLRPVAITAGPPESGNSNVQSDMTTEHASPQSLSPAERLRPQRYKGLHFRAETNSPGCYVLYIGPNTPHVLGWFPSLSGVIEQTVQGEFDPEDDWHFFVLVFADRALRKELDQLSGFMTTEDFFQMHEADATSRAAVVTERLDAAIQRCVENWGGSPSDIVLLKPSISVTHNQ